MPRNQSNNFVASRDSDMRFRCPRSRSTRSLPSGWFRERGIANANRKHQCSSQAITGITCNHLALSVVLIRVFINISQTRWIGRNLHSQWWRSGCDVTLRKWGCGYKSKPPVCQVRATFALSNNVLACLRAGLRHFSIMISKKNFPSWAFRAASTRIFKETPQFPCRKKQTMCSCAIRCWCSTRISETCSQYLRRIAH